MSVKDVYIPAAFGWKLVTALWDDTFKVIEELAYEPIIAWNISGHCPVTLIGDEHDGREIYALCDSLGGFYTPLGESIDNAEDAKEYLKKEFQAQEQRG